MSDLISREALMKKAQSKCGRNCNECDFAQDMDSWCDAELFGVEVLSAPSVDAVPAVHGEWILKHVGAGHYWECSSCHKNPCIYVTENTNFCPNCGAKMDGGK